MSQIIKPLLLCTLLEISFSDYFLPNIKDIDHKDSVLVTAKSNPSIHQNSSQNNSENLSSLDTSATKAVYQRLMQTLGERKITILPINEVLQTDSTKFLGATYREGLLDQDITDLWRQF